VSPPAPAAPPLPAWRAELNEKVRAIRANRSAATSTSDAPVEELATSNEHGSRILSSQQDNSGIAYARDPRIHGAATHLESSQSAVATTTPARRSSNNIVEAALTRVKRATENASRAALPKIEPARSIQTQVSLSVDRQATARALEPAPEIESSFDITPAPLPEISQPTISKPSRIEAALPEKQVVESTAIAETSVAHSSLAEETIDLGALPIIDDLEPLDYLEAEVRKVDKALGKEFLKNESASIFTHAVIGLVDLLAIAVSCSPFLAFIRIADGSFSISQTRLASGAIVALIAFFYLALTQCLCGKTFGMMLTNTRIVDAQAFETPSPSQALVRTAGYFVAAAPAFAGLLWTIVDRKRRGWQDFISGTMVVRDF